MNNTHILVVDDDARLRQLLQDYLSRQGFFVSVAADTERAREKIAYFQFQAIVLDRMMPGENGVEFMQTLKAPHPPVLMLTALGEAQARIEGLEAGVKDYLPKPFEPKELVLRLRNILAQQRPISHTVQFGDYVLDMKARLLTQSSKPVHLTSQEMNSLYCLAETPGAMVSRQNLASILGLAEDNSRAVDVQINRLRKKIEPEPSKPVYIHTVRGEGYILRGSQ